MQKDIFSGIIKTSKELEVLMRAEVFMLSLLHQQGTPAFLYSESEISKVGRESTYQLEKRVTRLGREFLFLWSEIDLIEQFTGNYFTRNVKILADFFRLENPQLKKFGGFVIKKRDANFDMFEDLSNLFIKLTGFAKRGKYQPNTNPIN